jgi:hypothetical protein
MSPCPVRHAAAAAAAISLALESKLPHYVLPNSWCWLALLAFKL